MNDERKTVEAPSPTACSFVTTVALAVSVALTGCGGRRVTPTSVGSARQASEYSVASNVLRADYAGSAACESCHDDAYRAWSTSPMHNMTRAAEKVKTRAPFSATTFRFKDDTAELYERNGERFVRVVSPSDGEHRYRVTRVIGGHHREDFAGVEVSSDAKDAPSLGRPGDELILPLSYVYATQSFRLKGYSVMVGARPGLRAGGVWNKTCILCHNTAPYFWSIFDALLGPGARAYQGEVVDRLLPLRRRWAFEVNDSRAFGNGLDSEIRALGGDPGSRGALPRLESVVENDSRHARESPVQDPELRSRLAGAIETTKQSLNAGSLVELGIGCESCHGGASEHVANPKKLPTFVPVSTFLSTLGPESGDSTELRAATATANAAITRSGAINHACARCHQVLFSRYPFTWEGGDRRSHPGGSHISSGEGRDFLLGGCSNALACTACHDPHGADDPNHLRELGTVAGNRVCVGCHARYGTRDALAAHSHHAPDGAGAVCINCHMPQKNMGLDYALVRYHRIGSPDDPQKVERDRPIECAICHKTASVDKLVSTMQAWWHKSYDKAALTSLYGADGSVSVLEATLDRGKPHEKVVAVSLLGTERATSAVPGIARELLDPYPLVRYYAVDALARIANDPNGARAIDLDGNDAEIAHGADAWLAGHGFAPVFGAAAPTAVPHDETKTRSRAPAESDED